MNGPRVVGYIVLSLLSASFTVLSAWAHQTPVTIVSAIFTLMWSFTGGAAIVFWVKEIDL
jgi:hypothetical protein